MTAWSFVCHQMNIVLHSRLLIAGIIVSFVSSGFAQSGRQTTPLPSAAKGNTTWQLGTPIVTYWAGPTMTDAVARQMAEGGWNLVWCGEKELDVSRRHGLRAQLNDGLLTPESLNDPKQRAKLDALIDRVRKHPALYSYFIRDEPSARPISPRLENWSPTYAPAIRPFAHTSTYFPPTRTTANSARKAIWSRPIKTTCGTTSAMSSRRW